MLSLFDLELLNLSVAVDNNPGVDVENDHGNYGEDSKAMVDVPVNDQSIKRPSSLFVVNSSNLQTFLGKEVNKMF